MKRHPVHPQPAPAVHHPPPLPPDATKIPTGDTGFSRPKAPAPAPARSHVNPFGLPDLHIPTVALTPVFKPVWHGPFPHEPPPDLTLIEAELDQAAASFGLPR